MLSAECVEVMAGTWGLLSEEEHVRKACLESFNQVGCIPHPTKLNMCPKPSTTALLLRLNCALTGASGGRRCGAAAVAGSPDGGSV